MCNTAGSKIMAFVVFMGVALFVPLTLFIFGAGTRNSPPAPRAANLATASPDGAPPPAVQLRNRGPESDAATALEIATLVTQLGDGAYAIREKAMKRLTEVGVPALTALQDVEEKGALETRNRAAILVKNIRRAAGLPIRVNGIEFSIVTPRKWLIPKSAFTGQLPTRWLNQKPGEETQVEFELKITNTTNTPHRFFLLLREKLLLITSKGTLFPASGGGYWSRTVWPEVSPLLRKHDSYTLSYKAKLILLSSGITIYCWDPFNVSWEIQPLPEGTHRLTLVYENDQRESDNGDILWVGKAEVWTNIDLVK